MSFKDKLETYPGEVGPRVICKKCFEKYQKHEPVDHNNCFFLIQSGGGLDVKAPSAKTKDTK